MLKNYDVSVNGILDLINNNFEKHLNYENLKSFLVKNNVNIINNNFVLSLSSFIFNKVMLDVKFIASLDPSQNSENLVLQTKTKGLIATMCYRTATIFYYENFIEDKELRQKLAREFMEQVAVDTGVDIHPQARIDEMFFIDHAKNIVIGATTLIGKRCNLFNDVVLGSKNVKSSQNIKRHPTILNDVTICAGARVLGDITIGNNVFICPQAVVTDNIPDNTTVSIVNQLQLTKRINTLPSQKLTIFGVVPKFKNCIKILGEGFYNPTVLIKLKNEKTLNYQITFWDKNKIIVKFKNKALTSKDLVGIKLIVLSNADKVIVLNSFGLNKTLLSLCD